MKCDHGNQTEPTPLPPSHFRERGRCLLDGVTQGSAKTAWRNRWAECCNLVEVGEMCRAARGRTELSSLRWGRGVG